MRTHTKKKDLSPDKSRKMEMNKVIIGLKVPIVNHINFRCLRQ